MTTLYIDRRNLTLSIQNEALVFHEENQRINTIPLNILERICIQSTLTLSSQVLSKLGEASIGIIILNKRQHRPTLLMPNWKLDGKRRQTQYAQSQNPHFCQTFAQTLIQNKTNQQIQLLQRHQAQNSSIKHTIHLIQQIQQQIPKSTTPNTLRGIEGSIATQYFNAWKALLPTELNFTGRNRRPPRDPINSLLSLGYTLLHFEIVKHIHLIGLDPYIGFYHTPEHGRESLACDLLEPLRPQYDQWLLQHIHQQTFSAQDFSTTTQGCTLNKPARLRFYQHYEELAQTWRNQIHQQCRQLLKQLNHNEPNQAQQDTLLQINPPERKQNALDNHL